MTNFEKRIASMGYVSQKSSRIGLSSSSVTIELRAGLDSAIWHTVKGGENVTLCTQLANGQRESGGQRDAHGLRCYMRSFTYVYNL